MGNPLHGFEYSGEDEAERVQLERLTKDWMRITTHLLENRRDYDHLDPELLAEADLTDGIIQIGVARYDVLILPPMLNLDAAGGTGKRFVREEASLSLLGCLRILRFSREAQREMKLPSSLVRASSHKRCTGAVSA